MHFMDIGSQSEEAVPINIFLFKFSNGNTREWCELYSELTIKTLEHQDDIDSFRSVSLNDFEKVNVCWDVIKSLLNCQSI